MKFLISLLILVCAMSAGAEPNVRERALWSRSPSSHAGIDTGGWLGDGTDGPQATCTAAPWRPPAAPEASAQSTPAPHDPARYPLLLAATAVVAWTVARRSKH